MNPLTYRPHEDLDALAAQELHLTPEQLWYARMALTNKLNQFMDTLVEMVEGETEEERAIVEEMRRDRELTRATLNSTYE